MNIVLLSGGSGKRLWPLSNDVRSKQFLKIYKTENGSYESMVQRVFRQIKTVNPDSLITIATSKSQVSAIKNQLGEQVSLSVEPTRRDTFPAIALAVSYMHNILGLSFDEPVAVCPVDHFVDQDYYCMVEKMCKEARQGEAEIILMGIEPTCPSDKYGYIIPSDESYLSWVKQFKEKPKPVMAKKYINDGALWNAGVFAFSVRFILNLAEKILGTSDYEKLYNSYSDLTRISFDYAVVEKTKNIKVFRYNGLWRDIGSWTMLTQTMTETTVGNVICDNNCMSSHAINNLDIPILCMGLKNITVATSPDGILVADNQSADQIKEYVEHINQSVMYAEKSWGNFHVLDVSPNSLTIKVTMKVNDNMTYHSHDNRNEVWTVVSGKGKTIIDGVERFVESGDVITIQAGQKHTIFSLTDMVLIEVQIGKDITASDKHKYEMPIF